MNESQAVERARAESGLAASQQVQAEVRAIVQSELPQRLYRLATEIGERIVAAPSPRLQRQVTRLQRGQWVTVRRAPADPGRGTIVSVGGDVAADSGVSAFGESFGGRGNE